MFGKSKSIGISNMSKELEALNNLVERLAIKKYDDKGNLICWESTIDKEYNIIETALKRLEELEKAFKLLSKEDEKTKKFLTKEIEKNRALEIIKKHKLLNYVLKNEKCANMYHLSQEDKDFLLKEVLKNE